MTAAAMAVAIADIEAFRLRHSPVGGIPRRSEHEVSHLIRESAEQHDQRGEEARPSPSGASPRKPALRIVISLKNSPKGGEPVIITRGEHEQRARDRRTGERPAARSDRSSRSCAAARACRQKRAPRVLPVSDRSCAATPRTPPPRAPSPTPTAMMPTCSMLEYASSRLRFHWIKTNGVAISTESRPSVSSKPLRELRSQRGLRNQMDPQDAIQRAIQHADGHQHHGWRRRFTIRIGLPCVHRGQTSLGPVADQRKHDAEPQRKWMQLRRHLHETRPVERGHAFAERTLPGREQQHGPQQRKGEAEAAQHQKFPCRLERGVRYRET